MASVNENIAKPLIFYTTTHFRGFSPTKEEWHISKVGPDSSL